METLVQVVTLGRRWGFYGSIAANVGAYLSSTAFIAFLDDDDELAVGAGDILRGKLASDPGARERERECVCVQCREEQKGFSSLPSG
jgi:hypothetical protein